MSSSNSTLTALCRSGRSFRSSQPAFARGCADRAVEVEFLVCAGTGEAAQRTQGELDVARAQLARVVEIAELALLPDLDRAALVRFAADANAFGVVAGMAERRGAAGTDPA